MPYSSFGLSSSAQCGSQQGNKVFPEQQCSLSYARAFMCHVERILRVIFRQPDWVETTDERADFIDPAVVVLEEDAFAFTLLHRNFVGPVPILGICEFLLFQARVFTDLCNFRGEHDYPSLAIPNITAASGAADALPADFLWIDEVRNWLESQLPDNLSQGCFVL